jgi:hypothetical protein
VTTRWTDSPCIWRSWKCQLLRAAQTTTAELAELVVDAVALEPLRSASTVVDTGAPFALRVACDEANEAALDEVSGWADNLESVLILGGRHGRQSWLCVSRRHHRLVLLGASWAVRPADLLDAAGRLPAAVGLPRPNPQRAFVGTTGGPR